MQPDGRGGVLRASQFLNDDTGVLMDAGARDVSIIGSIFRGSARAGVWFVAPAPAVPTAPAVRSDAAAGGRRCTSADHRLGV